MVTDRDGDVTGEVDVDVRQGAAVRGLGGQRRELARSRVKTKRRERTAGLAVDGALFAQRVERASIWAPSDEGRVGRLACEDGRAEGASGGIELRGVDAAAGAICRSVGAEENLERGGGRHCGREEQEEGEPAVTEKRSRTIYHEGHEAHEGLGRR